MKLFRKSYYIFLYCIFKFNKWHISTIDERDYAKWIIKKVNLLIPDKSSSKQIIEVGCGLGDIISGIHVPNRKKIGYDIEANVIKALKFAHPGLQGKVGSLKSIENEIIDILIAVNWLHAVDDDWFCSNMECIIKHNYIQRIIIDVVPVPPYDYSHDYIGFFNIHGYILETKSRGFRCSGRGMRYILIFKKAHV